MEGATLVTTLMPGTWKILTCTVMKAENGAHLTHVKVSSRNFFFFHEKKLMSYGKNFTDIESGRITLLELLYLVYCFLVT